MSDPLVHLVVTVVADQEGTAMRGEVVVFVGTEQIHREALPLRDGPFDLQRGALALHELGLEALDVLEGTRVDVAPPSPAEAPTRKGRAPKRRSGQAPARSPGDDVAEAEPQDQWVRTSTNPRSRLR